MLDPKFFENLAKQLSQLIPPGLHSMRDELTNNFKTTLVAIFSKLDLVTREEFDVQAKLLERARDRIATLEERVRSLEEAQQ